MVARAAVATAAALALAAAAALLLLLDRGEPETARLPGGAALAVRHSLSPAVSAFGDRLAAEVRVVADPRRVDVESIRLDARFAPWRRLRPLAVERRRSAGLVVVVIRADLACIEIPCVSRRDRATFELPPATLRFTAGGAPERRELAWPPVEVVSRLAAAIRSERNADESLLREAWRARVALAEASRRAPAALLAAALIAGGVLLLAAAAALALVAAAPLAAYVRRAGPLSPLERALRALEQAQASGDAIEQRKALEALAHELGASGERELEAAARSLAWSQAGPSDDGSRSLAGQVEGALAAANGWRRR